VTYNQDTLLGINAFGLDLLIFASFNTETEIGSTGVHYLFCTSEGS
jgi:hypothetical protein